MEEKPNLMSHKKFYKIETPNIFLLPYLKQMVKKYHHWMQSPELLELTASEPLSLDEEYENQISWLADPTKYTFIIFKKMEDKQSVEDGLPEICKGGKMVGDINLFMHKYFDDNEAEIDVMIAEPDTRKEGIATQTVKIMVNLAVKEYKKNKIWAKIKDDNFPSIKLFEKLGFVKIKELPSFGEVHYALEIAQDVVDQGSKVFFDVDSTEIVLDVSKFN